MKHKRVYLEAAIILVMLFVGYLFWPKDRKPKPGVPEGANFTIGGSEAVLLSTPGNGSPGGKNSGGNPAPEGNPPGRSESGNGDSHKGLTFEQAMNIYGASGYRYQLADCHGNPGRLTVKQGVSLMLDNRDGAAREVRLGGEVYQLNEYDFAIVSPAELGTFSITCSGGGAAEIWVQP